MPSFVTELLPVIVLVGLGAVLGARSILTIPTIDGLKRLVSGVTLPVLLFSAFSRMRPEAPHLILAAAIFAACALMGLIGSAVARLFRLPSPATALMLQGFEAGMLGYALFASFYGADRTPAFAAADLGQVLYVFTILMARLGVPPGVSPSGAPGDASSASPSGAAGNGAKNLAA
ncbi:MAG: AEC family transporter, partial [Rectinema sp.]